MSVTHYTTLVLEHRAKCAEDIKKDKSFSLANYRARFLLKVRKTQIREVFNHYHTTSVEIVKCLLQQSLLLDFVLPLAFLLLRPMSSEMITEMPDTSVTQ